MMAPSVLLSVNGSTAPCSLRWRCSNALSSPPKSFCGGLDRDYVVVGHNNHISQVLSVVAAGDEDDPLLSGDMLSLFLPPQLSCGGLDEVDTVVVPR